MREKWILRTIKADFNALSAKLGVHPLIVRCMVNRGLQSPEEMRDYLYGTVEELPDGRAMKDMEKALSLLEEARQNGWKAAIASDYDCDGICSGYLLLTAFSKMGIDAKIYTPDRIKEGYGLNRRIVDDAAAEGRTLLITCDNGIAALSEISYAKEKEMTVIVTDHHEVQECLPEADAVLDPKQPGDGYPFKNLCGAGVVFKLIGLWYDMCGIPPEEKWKLLPYTAIATVADVMELKGENRILVKTGLRMLPEVDNPGLQALLEVQNLKGKKITAGHIGFIIGPCFNAAGRIASVEEAFALLMERDKTRAVKRAAHLKEINDSRKQMTEEAAKQAFEILDKTGEENLPPVIILLLPDIHESLTGLVASRIKERYNHPSIVFTRIDGGMAKGSGRSVSSYDMFAGLMQCKDLMFRFGGHKMAAGMTLPEKDLPELDRRLNINCALTMEDFRPVIHIDAPMPVGYADEQLLGELERMEPFGTGNPKPVFAEQHFRVLSGRRIGKENNVLRLSVQNDAGTRIDALMFHGADDFEAFITEEWGEKELQKMYQGKENCLDIALTYFPQINDYNGTRTMQIQITEFCRVGRK